MMNIETRTTITLMAAAVIATMMVLCANMTINDLISAF